MRFRKEVHAILPTFDRMRLIQRTVSSILQSSYQKTKITIIVDVNAAYFHRLKELYCKQPGIQVLFNEQRLGWPKSLNRVLALTDDDVYLYGADDIYLHKMTIEIALNTLEQLFQGDGVIGFQQNLMHFCPAAFGMFGRAWVERFPERQVFYPRYIHFCGDSELWHYAKQINRFHFCKNCRVEHARERDRCKNLAQTTLTSDREIWRPRKAAGKFWPKYK